MLPASPSRARSTCPRSGDVRRASGARSAIGAEAAGIRRAHRVPAGDERIAKPWQSPAGVSRAALDVGNLPHKHSPVTILGIR